jgi:hypothetical protein
MRYSTHRALMSVCAIAVVYLATSTGCGDQTTTARQRLVGKWEISADAFREAIKAEMAKKSKGEQEDAAMANMVDAMLEQMKVNFEFTQDGKVNIAMSAMGQDRSETGTYEIVGVDGDNVTLKIITEKDNDEPGKLKFIDDDTIELTPPEGEAAGPGGMKTLILNRMK